MKTKPERVVDEQCIWLDPAHYNHGLVVNTTLERHANELQEVLLFFNRFTTEKYRPGYSLFEYKTVKYNTQKERKGVERKEANMTKFTRDQMENHRFTIMTAKLVGEHHPSLVDWYLWYWDLDMKRFDRGERRLITYNKPQNNKTKKTAWWKRLLKGCR